MNRLLHGIVVSLMLVLMIGTVSETRAQILQAFHIQQGLTVATAKAKDTLASDAVLVFAGTFGELDLSELVGLPVVLNFYQDSVPRAGLDAAKYPGQADGWGYVFYSPSLDRSVNLFVANSIILGGMTALGVPIPVPVPGGLVSPVDSDVPGFRSDSLMKRLKRDTAYAQYHFEHRAKQPSFVTIGNIIPDSLPAGFPASGATWSVTFLGTRDTVTGEEQVPGMVCVVAAESGATVCRRVAAPALSSVAHEDATIGHAALAVVPNPATGRTRVTVIVSDGLSHVGAEVMLVDVTGRAVMNLSESFAHSGYVNAEFDASALPIGLYFVRVNGRQWSGNVGVVVGR